MSGNGGRPVLGLLMLLFFTKDFSLTFPGVFGCAFLLSSSESSESGYSTNAIVGQLDDIMKFGVWVLIR